MESKILRNKVAYMNNLSFLTRMRNGGKVGWALWEVLKLVVVECVTFMPEVKAKASVQTFSD